MYPQIPANCFDTGELATAYARLLGNYLHREYLNFEAIFSDESERFAVPAENGVTIRLRAFRDNITEAYLHAGEQSFIMRKAQSDELFDYFAVTAELSDCRYYFTVEKNGRVYFYNKRGLYQTLNAEYNFNYLPGFKLPDWAPGAVMYQIYVDRFNNGDTSNDVTDNEYMYLGRPARKAGAWNTPVTQDDVCTFYGGDLKGVMDKLGYLRELGVEVIYLNPLFVSPSNHKYDIQDYDYIDPHYGVIVNDGGEPLSMDKPLNRYASMYLQRTTDKVNLEASNALFCRLVELAHENGIRVIIDGVFNHCGAFNKWLDKEGFYYSAGYAAGAYRDENSAYHSYFNWYDSNWPNNDCYDSWWNHANHPKLNYEASPELYAYVMALARKWVSPPFNADGWRLDVAADVGCSPEFNHRFWADFRRAVKDANPEAIIIAEHYGDPSAWLRGDQWDTIMNYDAFMEPITWFLTGMEKHSESFRPELRCNAMAFEDAMRYNMARLPLAALNASMNQLSNHDHSRFLTRTNMTVGRLHNSPAEAADSGISISVFMEAVVFQMTWPGSPAIYYGDEAGLTGWTDPDNRRPYPWGRENAVLMEFHKKLLALRKRLRVLRNGSHEFLYNDYGILSYGRFDDDEKVVVMLNNNDCIRRMPIPVWKLGVRKNSRLELLMLTGQDDFSTEKMHYEVTDGFAVIALMPYSSIILREVQACNSPEMTH